MPLLLQLETSRRVGVIILRTTARARLCVKPTSTGFFHCRSFYACRRTMVSREGWTASRIHVTADEARRDFLRSPVTVHAVNLAVDQDTGNFCLLAPTISKSSLVPHWQKLVRGDCLEREKKQKCVLFFFLRLNSTLLTGPASFTIHQMPNVSASS